MPPVDVIPLSRRCKARTRLGAASSVAPTAFEFVLAAEIAAAKLFAKHALFNARTVGLFAISLVVARGTGLDCALVVGRHLAVEMRSRLAHNLGEVFVAWLAKHGAVVLLD